MDFPLKPLSAEQLKTKTPLMSIILRGGVIISAALVGFGLILFLVTGQSGYLADQNSHDVQNYTTYHELNNNLIYFPTTPQEVLDGVLAGKSFAIIMLGLYLLILTPVVNVALAVLTFIRKGDRIFVLISGFVLLMLFVSYFLG